VNIIELKYIDDVAYISRRDLARILKITTQNINLYEKRDNPLVRADIPHDTIHYDLIYALKWNANEIEHKHRRDDFTGVSTGDEDYMSGDRITSKNIQSAKAYSEAMYVIHKERMAEIDLKVKRGEYISSENVDKTQKSFITILLQTLTNKLISLPPKLENKKNSEISKSLEYEFKDLVIQLKKALKKALVNEE